MSHLDRNTIYAIVCDTPGEGIIAVNFIQERDVQYVFTDRDKAEMVFDTLESQGHLKNCRLARFGFLATLKTSKEK